MNLPNRLTVLRLIMVPVFIAVMVLPDSVVPALVTGIIGAFLFITAAVTDMLDGKNRPQVRSDNGFRQADGSAGRQIYGHRRPDCHRVPIRYAAPVFIRALLVVVFRELAVTSLRLVASTSGGVVVPANMLGKIKTVSQIVCVSAAIIEPMLYEIPFLRDFLPGWWTAHVPLTYITCAAMTLFTVLSGVNYFRAMWKYLDPGK